MLMFFGFSVLSITFYPKIWYTVDSEATETEASSLTEEIGILNDQEKEDITKDIISNLPPLDTSLSETNSIKISSIGVDSKIVQNLNSSQGLEEGIWIVPEYGNPENNNLPIIIAAHRFGYVYWSSEFRVKSSFYNLPKLKVGDRVQIIWNQRSYEYEVYKAENSSQISDYDADLILYTCKMYNSPERVFRYLNRIN